MYLAVIHLLQLTQRALLDHDAHDLEEDVGGGHGGELGVCVVGGRDLDDVRADEVEGLEAAQDRAEFAGRPAAGFGGASGGGDFCRGRKMSV